MILNYLPTLIAAKEADLDFGGGFEAPTEAWLQRSDIGNDTEVVSTLEKFISNLIGVMTVLAALFFIVYFVTAAFKWATAGGDSGKISKAKDQMIQNTLGLILVIASYAIIGLLGSVIGFDLLNPGDVILNSLKPGP
jgi:type IV secretion system pilin